jgi:SNF2 family DNA or RNA helicase
VKVLPSDRSERLDALVNALVDGGRFVPGLTVDESGRGRSWWWPMPAASDRPELLTLLDGDDVEDHRRLASELGDLVDSEVRTRLVRAGLVLTPRRPGRKRVPESWLNALVAPDPWMASSLHPDRVREFEQEVSSWVGSGVPATGRVRLCLRFVAPAVDKDDETGSDTQPTLTDELVSVDRDDLERSSDPDTWAVELLLQDTDEPSLIVSISQLWNGTVNMGDDAVEEVLGALGHVDRIAPELGDLLDTAAPVWSEVDASTALELLRDRLGALGDAGIAVLLPTWWTQRKRVSMRMRARSSSTSPGSAVSAGLGIDKIVKFRWEAALGGVRLTKRDLAQLEAEAAAKHTIVRFRGEWVEITPESLADLTERIGKTAEASVAELLKASLGLSELDVPPDVDIDRVVASGWLGNLLDDALHASVQPVPTPENFNGELRPYQERGVGWLGFLGQLGLGACLADDMGLGKTAQVIAALLEADDNKPTLVVCPVSVLGNWRSELERFAPELTVLVHHGPGRHADHDEPFAERAASYDVVLTTYSLVGRDAENLGALTWARLVLDEAQAVKNPSAKQTRAVGRLRADQRIALTGTPVENRLSELWSIMHILNPGLLGTASVFRRRFAIPIERDRDEQTTDDLLRLTRPFILRRLKSDRSIISDLPDKIETTDHCPLTREQATLYQAVVDDMLADADEADGMKRKGLVLSGLMRLKQICNHPAHYLGDGSALAGRSGKLTRVEELLDELLSAGDKALCFTQFRAWGDALQPYLEQRLGVEVAWLHGGLSRAKREAMVESFEDPDGPRVFLISLRAGGTGLNLTAAAHVIHLDRWWNPAVEDQATDRAYRIGQRKNVFVHKLVSAGTVEERIDDMIAAKRELAQRVLGSGEDWVTELSTDDLRDLVALRPTDIDNGDEETTTAGPSSRSGRR